MSDVFLSYATQDRERIRPLVDALEASGWSVWWDRRIPAGRAYAEVIEAAIHDAQCMLVVWTKASVESEWVREEADRGKRRRLLVPVRLDDVEPPLGFGQIQAADLIGWDGTRTAPGFRQLRDDVASILGTARTAGGATTQAKGRAPPEAASAEAIGASEAAPLALPTEAVAGRRTAVPAPGRRRLGLWIGAILVGLAVVAMSGYWYLAQQENERREQAQREQRRLDTLKARDEREAKLAQERREAEEAAREQERLAALRGREQQEVKSAEESRRSEEAARQVAAPPPFTAGIGGIEQQQELAAEIGWPDRVRCFGYDPASLRIGRGPNRDLAVIADNFQLARAENAADAEAIMRIARAHHAQCMVGLDRHAPNGRQWVFVFWERGAAPTLLEEGCYRYDPARLDIRNEGPNGWALVAFEQQLGGHRPLHMLNDEADARVALAYAKRFRALCFIGQLGKDQDAYLVRYWMR